MKKTISILTVVILSIALVFSFGGVALAEDNVDWSAYVTPDSLSAAGNVTLSVTVTCNGDDISSVQLTLPDQSSVTVADYISSGQSATYKNESYYIPDNSFDTPLGFTLTYYNADGSMGTKTGTITVAKKAGTVKVTGSASVDNKTVTSGEKAKFTFNFKNEGDVKIENATLKAPPLEGGSTLGQAFSLDPGDSKEMTWSTAITSDITVKPTLTYTAGGSNKTLELDAIDVATKQAEPTASQTASGISVSLTADKTEINAGDTVVFTAVVTNTGSDALSNVALTTSSGATVDLPKNSLEAGSNTTATFEEAINESKNVQLNVSATNSAGTQISGSSSSVAITVGGGTEPAETAAPDDGTKKGLSIEVAPGLEMTDGKYVMDKGGIVNFVISIANTSDVNLNNVVVSEATNGEVENIGAMGKDSKTIQKSYEVKETGSYVFTVSATLDDGREVAVSATPIAIEVAGGGSGNWLMGLIIIIICAAAGVAIALFFVMKKNKKGGNGGGSYAPRSNQGGYANSKPAAPQRTTPRTQSARQQYQQTQRSRAYDAAKPVTREAPAYTERREEPAYIERDEPVREERAPRRAPLKVEEVKPAPKKQKGDVKFGDRNKF